MNEGYVVTEGLHGRYRDVIRDGNGRIRYDSGWMNNTIVVDCRRLLAGFMRGAPTVTVGIEGLQLGAGLDLWDQTGAPQPAPGQTQLVDPNPHTVDRASLRIDYLDPATGNVSALPTSRIQIVAQIRPGVPPWPDGNPNHASPTLREFGLVARLDGNTVLINSVRHPAIPKDPTSTLDRTIWLVF